jgi:hypothetical protein
MKKYKIWNNTVARFECDSFKAPGCHPNCPYKFGWMHINYLNVYYMSHNTRVLPQSHNGIPCGVDIDITYLYTHNLLVTFTPQN